MVVKLLDNTTWCAQICGRRFATTGLGYVAAGMGSIDGSSMGSYYLSIETYGLSLTVLSYFSWFQKRFPPPARPTRIQWQMPLNQPFIWNVDNDDVGPSWTPFSGQGAKISNDLQIKKWYLNHAFQICLPFSNRLDGYHEIATLTWLAIDALTRFAADLKYLVMRTPSTATWDQQFRTF